LEVFMSTVVEWAERARAGETAEVVVQVLAGFLGGMLVQRVAPVRRPWVCASGTLILAGAWIANGWITHRSVDHTDVLARALQWLAAILGARLMFRAEVPDVGGVFA
jgi:hypothetical protein